jgi:3',5'-cyclic-nucleotide phosphodiesterase
MPLSPSTRGTSILSDVDSSEKNHSNYTSDVVTPTGMTPTTGFFGAESSSYASPKRSNGDSNDVSSPGRERQGRSQSRSGERTDDSPNGHANGANAKGVVVVEKVRNLKKKPSRFRMNFWKRSKSASPPVPTSGNSSGRGASQEDMRSN